MRRMRETFSALVDADHPPADPFRHPPLRLSSLLQAFLSKLGSQETHLRPHRLAVGTFYLSPYLLSSSPPLPPSPLSLSLFLIFQFSDTEIFNEFLSLLNPINEAFNTFTNDIFIELIVTITRLDISSRHYLENYHHNMDAKNTCHHLIVRSAIHGHNIDSVMKYHLMVIQTQTHPQTRFRLRPIPDAISNESEQQFGSRSLPAFSLFRNIDNVIVNLIPIESVGHYRFILLSVGFRP